VRATDALRTAGLSILTVENWNPDGGRGQFGIAAVLLGTVFIGGIAVGPALPLALGGALYIASTRPADCAAPWSAWSA
jgi:phosphate transport system permease protein